MKKILLFSLLSILAFTQCKKGQDNKTYVHPQTTQVDTNLVLPPSWAFGVLYGAYTNQEQSIQRVNEIIEHDYPIDAYWIDSWFWDHANEGRGPVKYMDFIADTIGFPDRKGMWDYFESKNIKGGFWVWDCIFETGNEAAFKDFLDKGYFRNTYVESNPWHNNSTTTAMHQTEGGSKKGTLCGNIDFNNPEAVAYFKERMKHFFDEGADFVKLDRTSAIPVCKVMFELSQEFGKETKGRGLIFSHTGGQETEEYKKYPGKWTDDTRCDWNIENPNKKFNSWVPNIAFKENIAMYLDPAKKSSLIPFMAQDMGGFDMGITDKLDEELYIRWAQFSFFCPIVTTFAQPENKTANMPYLISSRTDSIYRDFSHLRMELFPYIYSYAHLNRLTGEHMMRKLPGQIYEYLFGNEIFVAPVYEQGATQRDALLPEGNWINYWTGELFEGKKNYTIDAPINQIPLFIRQGAIIPMREYARSIESGNNDLLILHIYPRANGEFTLIEDEGNSNNYLKGIYAKTVISLKENNGTSNLSIAPLLGYYEGMKNERNWKVCIHSSKPVSELSLNGKSISFKKEGKTYVSETFTSNKYIQNDIKINY